MNKAINQLAKTKVWSIFFVRFLPFIIFSHIYYVTNYSYEGVLIEDSEFLLGNSAIYAVCLLILSIKDERYHCVWNRAMWCELIFIPTFNYLDSKIFFLDDLMYMKVMNMSMNITSIVTAILAFNHFILPRIRKMNYGTNE